MSQLVVWNIGNAINGLANAFLLRLTSEEERDQIPRPFTLHCDVHTSRSL